jgi:hypothetical protein
MKRVSALAFLISLSTFLFSCGHVGTTGSPKKVEVEVLWNAQGNPEVPNKDFQISVSKSQQDVALWYSAAKQFTLKFPPNSQISDCTAQMHGGRWECEISVFPKESSKDNRGNYVPFIYSIDDPNAATAAGDPLIIVEH